MTIKYPKESEKEWLSKWDNVEHQTPDKGKTKYAMKSLQEKLDAGYEAKLVKKKWVLLDGYFYQYILVWNNKKGDKNE